MKITVIHGSPRKHRNSDTMVESFLKGLHGENSTFHFYTNEMNIRGCQGCLKCDQHLEHFCATEDDMQQIYRAFIESDIIVFATPMYWGYMTAQMKAVMDRMEAITGYFKNKIFVVLITYRHHCESTVNFFKRVCPFFGVDLHLITCRTMDEKENDLPISAFPDKLQEAFALGAILSNP